MSAFTDRLYADLVRLNGGSGRPPRREIRSVATVNQYAAWRKVTGRGMGGTPMERSGTDPALTQANTATQAGDAGQTVNLSPGQFAPD